MKEWLKSRGAQLTPAGLASAARAITELHPDVVQLQLDILTAAGIRDPLQAGN